MRPKRAAPPSRRLPIASERGERGGNGVIAPGAGRDLDHAALEELCRRVKAAFRGPPNWHDRIWAAGLAAMRFLREDPERARALAADSGGGDSDSVDLRDEIVQRIADLLDGGRGEVAGRPMSRCTAEIAAGAVYNTILAKVTSGAIEHGEEFLPELIYMATMPYLGARAAEDELAVQPLR
jgi:hypothetical protein